MYDKEYSLIISDTYTAKEFKEKSKQKFKSNCKKRSTTTVDIDDVTGQDVLCDALPEDDAILEAAHSVHQIISSTGYTGIRFIK